MNDTLKRAISCYEARQTRAEHPDGEFGKGYRWYPSDTEKCPCCDNIRSPSRAYPFSLMVHCRTAAHIAQLYGVPVQSILASERKTQSQARRSAERVVDIVWKVVGLREDNKMISIFDGETIYSLRRAVSQRARANHNGGIYAYRTHDAALKASFPDSSKALTSPRILLKCRASGKRIEYKGGKISYSRLVPIEATAL